MAARINLRKIPKKGGTHTITLAQRHTSTPQIQQQKDDESAMICRRQFPNILDFNHCGAELKVKNSSGGCQMANAELKSHPCVEKLELTTAALRESSLKLSCFSLKGICLAPKIKMQLLSLEVKRKQMSERKIEILTLFPCLCVFASLVHSFFFIGI